MELESMKSLWQAHETGLKQTSTLNDHLLRRIIHERSHHLLEKIKNTEYVIGSLTLLFLAIFLLMANRLGSAPEMVISYIITIAAFVTELALSVYKLVSLSRIDMSAGSVTDTARKIRRFQLFITRERLISVLALFIVAPAVYILVFQWVQHTSALDYPGFSITEVAIVLVLGIVFSLIIYRRFYLNNLRSIIANLKEIEDFKKESYSPQ